MDSTSSDTSSEDGLDRPVSPVSASGRKSMKRRGREKLQMGDSESDWIESEAQSIESSDAEESRTGTPLKHFMEADDTPASRPFKRKRHNGKAGRRYLDLLNVEILDMIRGDQAQSSQDSELRSSQIGMVRWSAEEKEALFQAVARLGRSNLPAIAARVASKGEVEVNHFLSLLHDSSRERRHSQTRNSLVMAEYPAAAELSQQCSHAQEEAADELSLRFERREEMRQEKIWGELWDIRPEIAASIDKDRLDFERGMAENGKSRDEDGSGRRQARGKGNGQRGLERPACGLPCSVLFHLSAWLTLSRRMFMNSAVPASNWHGIEDNPPSMWATTFEDFHVLAVSITRRLVQTSLFFATKRVRTRRTSGYIPEATVRGQDVRSAIQYLGVSLDRRQFWRDSAKRLRLNVYHEPPVHGDEEDREPIPYEEVEKLLGGGGREEEGDAVKLENEHTGSALPGDVSSDEDYTDYLETESEEHGSSDSSSGQEAAEIRDESLEILKYTAGDYAEAKGMRRAILHRIAMERQQDKEADEVDEHNSWQEEVKMWKVLGLPSPTPIPRPATPKTLQRSVRRIDNFPSLRMTGRKRHNCE